MDYFGIRLFIFIIACIFLLLKNICTTKNRIIFHLFRKIFHFNKQFFLYVFSYWRLMANIVGVCLANFLFFETKWILRESLPVIIQLDLLFSGTLLRGAAIFIFKNYQV